MDGEEQRPVVAAAEARSEKVVRMPRGVLRRVVAGVACAEPQAECGRGECKQQHGRSDRGPSGAALDEPDPADPEARAGRVRPGAPKAALADALAGEHQQGGEQRERRGEHEQHPERCCDRNAVEEADAEREHAEERDHDGGSGEEDRAAGGVHRQLQRGADVTAVLAIGVAVARDDEEGVVDPDAEADHQRELGGEVDHVDQVAAEPDDAETGPEAEQRRHDRQAHREQRAEAEQQHDDGGEEADARCEAEARLLSLLDRLAAELDLEGGRAHGLGRGDHTVDGRLRQLVRALVELDGREADRAGLRDCVRAGLIGAHHAGDVR